MLLSSLCYNLHNFTFLIRSSGLRRNFGCELLACLSEIMAFAAFEQVMLFPLNLGMQLGRASLFLRGLSQKQCCSVGRALSLLSLSSLSPAERRQRELVPGWPCGILSSGYCPTACYWICKRKNEGDCLPSLHTGDRKCTWKRDIKTIAVPLVFFCLRWLYASGGLAFAVAWPLRSCFLSFNVTTILCSCHRTCISGNCEYHRASGINNES